MKVIFRIYRIIYESWSLSTDPPKLVTQRSSIEVDIGSRLEDADNTELTGIRAGNATEKVERAGLDRVGLWVVAES